jgi:hypothetical protein
MKTSLRHKRKKDAQRMQCDEFAPRVFTEDYHIVAESLDADVPRPSLPRAQCRKIHDPSNLDSSEISRGK